MQLPGIRNGPDLGRQDGVRHHDRERRHLLDRGDVKELLTRLRAVAKERLYDPERPYAYARTVYLDTPELEYLQSSTRGTTRRVRIRRYASAATPVGPACYVGASYLEVKESSALGRAKLRIAVPAPAVSRLVHGGLTLETYAGSLSTFPVLADLSRKLRSHLLSPTIATWYRRRSFVAVKDEVRLTIDQELSYCLASAADLDAERAGPDRAYRRGDPVVVEVKWRGDLPAWVDDVFAGFPEAHLFTKYRAGMQLTRRVRLAA